MTTGAAAQTDVVDPLTGGTDVVGQRTGTESSLSNWAGPYVTEMLGKGQALGNEGYNAYMGPLTAGSSELQDQAFQGIGSLTMPTDQMGVGGYQPQQFTGDIAQQYMNPYLQASLNPQLDEARRQSQISQMNNASRMNAAGSFGGSRQAVFDAENQAALQRNMAGITGQGYADAYGQALGQFNTEQDRGMDAQDRINEYGTMGLAALNEAGAVQRGIEGEGVAADKRQFEEERDFPYKQVQYMQSLLQDLPISAQAYNYQQPSYLNQIASDAGDFESFMSGLFGDGFAPKPEEKKETT